MMKLVRAVALLLAAIWPALPIPVQTQQYPTRPVRLIIPWPPGGITDVISRGLGAALTESLGQQVIPDNRPGAAGTLGVGIGAQANPDGYTLLMTDVPSLAISATLRPNLPYDPLKALEPIALPSRSPLVLVVNPKLGIKSIQQLIQYAKPKGKDFSFASSGPGSITHLTSERFSRETGLSPLHVPYKGGSPATAALVTGEAGMYFACIAAAIPHIKAGRLTLLGVTSPQRTKVFPDAPAVAEVLPKFEMGCNTGFFAPAGTPKPIIERLHAEAMKAVQQPRMKALLAQNAAEPAPYTPAQFKQHVADEVKSWGAVVRAAGLKLE